MKRSPLKRIIFVTLILAIAIVQLKAQKITTCYQILLEANNKNVFAKLAANGLYIDDFSKAKTGYVFVLDNNELGKLKGIKVPYKILITDLEPNCKTKVAVDLKKSDSSQSIDYFRFEKHKINKNLLPVAIINGGDTLNIYANDSITLTHSSSNYASLLWDSGNGTTSITDTVTFTYNAVGVYIVSLEAINLDGSILIQ